MNILLGQKAKTLTENTMMAPQKSSRTPIHLSKTRVSEYETHSLKSTSPLIRHCQKQGTIFQVDIIFVFLHESGYFTICAYGRQAYFQKEFRLEYHRINLSDQLAIRKGESIVGIAASNLQKKKEEEFKKMVILVDIKYTPSRFTSLALAR